MGDDTSRRIDGYLARGYYPVKWSHHPPEIKVALRAMGLRPGMKQCWANVQRFVLNNHMMGLGLDVEYHEGWAHRLIPFEHAWMVYRGEVLDLTLPPGDVEYHESQTYTAAEVAEALGRSGFYGAVDWRKLAEIHPMRAQFDALRALGSPGNPQED
jgi:hypothetical protein